MIRGRFIIRTQSTPTTWFILQAWRRNTGHNAQFNDRLVHVRLLLDVHVHIAPRVVESTQINIDDYCCCYCHIQRLIGKRRHLEEFCTLISTCDCVNAVNRLRSPRVCVFSGVWGFRDFSSPPNLQTKSRLRTFFQFVFITQVSIEMLVGPAREKREDNYCGFGCVWRLDVGTPSMHTAQIHTSIPLLCIA